MKPTGNWAAKPTRATSAWSFLSLRYESSPPTRASVDLSARTSNGLARNWCVAQAARHFLLVLQAGKDNARRCRIPRPDRGQQFGAVHAGHVHVRNDDVERRPLHQLQRRRPVTRGRDLPFLALSRQHHDVEFEQQRLIFDEQYALFHGNQNFGGGLRAGILIALHCLPERWTKLPSGL